MKLLQINTKVNTGSTGRIAEEIGKLAMKNSIESYVAFGRGNRPSVSTKIRIGSILDSGIHLLETRIFDKHGLSSRLATINFIKQIKRIEPNIIHLHNIHGYYLNFSILFSFFKNNTTPIIWTLHDSWAYTGHCAFYLSINCDKWKSKCHKCPSKDKYPTSWVFDRSEQNYFDKKYAFSNLKNLTIVTPSFWLKKELNNSFLSGYDCRVIHNGVDVNVFTSNISSNKVRSKYGLKNKKIILGVASIWDNRKGLADFLKLSHILDKDILIVLVGVTIEIIKKLPSNVIGIERTEDVKELAILYSTADVFVNPTYSDNFPTTNIESLACGTPVVTYDTGGSPEAIDEDTGSSVKVGDINGLKKAIYFWLNKDLNDTAILCRQRAITNFNHKIQGSRYIDLYHQKNINS